MLQLLINIKESTNIYFPFNMKPENEMQYPLKNENWNNLRKGDI